MHALDAMPPDERRLWDIFYREDRLPPDFMEQCEAVFCEALKPPPMQSAHRWSIHARSCVDYLARHPVYRDEYPRAKAPDLRTQRDAFYAWDVARTRAADAAGAKAVAAEISRQLALIDGHAASMAPPEAA